MFVIMPPGATALMRIGFFWNSMAIAFVMPTIPHLLAQ